MRPSEVNRLLGKVDELELTKEQISIPYIVGEKGPELIQPSEDGVVIPNDKLDSISQDVNRSRIKSVVQPIVQTIAQPVPSPFPVSIGVPVVKKMSASKLPNNIAKLIK